MNRLLMVSLLATSGFFLSPLNSEAQDGGRRIGGKAAGYKVFSLSSETRWARIYIVDPQGCYWIVELLKRREEYLLPISDGAVTRLLATVAYYEHEQYNLFLENVVVEEVEGERCSAFFHAGSSYH